jgi:hypothetical protein
MSGLFLPVLLLMAGLLVLGIVVLARWLEAQHWRRSLLAFSLRPPADISVDAVSGWFNAVNAATHAPLFSVLPAPPVAVELVATSRGIYHVLLVPPTMRDALLASVRACLPGVRIEELPGYLSNRPRLRVAAEASLSTHGRPLGAERAEVASSALLATMQPLHGAEQVVVQWIITGGGIPRPVPSVSTNSQGDGWFLDGRVSTDSEAVRAARLKQKEPLLRVSLRVGIAAANRARAYSVYGKVWGGAQNFERAGRRHCEALVVAGWAGGGSAAPVGRAAHHLAADAERPRARRACRVSGQQRAAPWRDDRCGPAVAGVAGDARAWGGYRSE